MKHIALVLTASLLLAACQSTLGVVQAADNRNAYTLVCRSADGTLTYGYGIGRR